MIVLRAFVRLTVNLEKIDDADLQKRWPDRYEMDINYKYKEHKGHKLLNIIYVKQRC